MARSVSKREFRGSTLPSPSMKVKCIGTNYIMIGIEGDIDVSLLF
jgi:hypothetical protein